MYYVLSKWEWEVSIKSNKNLDKHVYLYYRFGQKFADKVANPKDMIYFKKKLERVKKQEDTGL